MDSEKTQVSGLTDSGATSNNFVDELRVKNTIKMCLYGIWCKVDLPSAL